MSKGGVVVIFTVAMLMVAGYGFGRIITDIGFAVMRYRARRLAKKQTEANEAAIRKLFTGGTIYEVATWDGALPGRAADKERN